MKATKEANIRVVEATRPTREVAIAEMERVAFVQETIIKAIAEIEAIIYIVV